MTFVGNSSITQAVDVKVAVAELGDVNPFWIRSYPSHRTFAELYQDCVNHPDVVRSQTALDRVSRHFWCGERFLMRADSLHSLSPQTGGAAGRPEVSLVLRRDFYSVGPRQLAARNIEYTYVDAEDSIRKVIPRVLSKEEKPCCFDLCDWRGKRLDAEKSLAHYGLLPAWEETGRLPDRARLRLRTRTSWPAYALLSAGALAGLLLGYFLWGMLVMRVVIR